MIGVASAMCIVFILAFAALCYCRYRLRRAKVGNQSTNHAEQLSNPALSSESGTLDEANVNTGQRVLFHSSCDDDLDEQPSESTIAAPSHVVAASSTSEVDDRDETDPDDAVPAWLAEVSQRLSAVSTRFSLFSFQSSGEGAEDAAPAAADEASPSLPAVAEAVVLEDVEINHRGSLADRDNVEFVTAVRVTEGRTQEATRHPHTEQPRMHTIDASRLPPPALPDGWREFKTPDGRLYYQRPDGTTTWTIAPQERYAAAHVVETCETSPEEEAQLTWLEEVSHRLSAVSARFSLVSHQGGARDGATATLTVVDEASPSHSVAAEADAAFEELEINARGSLADRSDIDFVTAVRVPRRQVQERDDNEGDLAV